MWLVEAIDRARQIHAFDLWAYVVMPEHAHLLIWPRESAYSISGILTSIKRPVSRKALSYVRTSAPNFLSQMEDRQPGGRVHYRFWQRGGGYDRNLTEPKSIWAEIDYFHANPVRRGLCETPTAWPWSSARELEQPGSGVRWIVLHPSDSVSVDMRVPCPRLCVGCELVGRSEDMPTQSRWE